MMPVEWGAGDGEVAVVGLGRSGVAATRLLVRDGRRVYASDGVDSSSARAAADELQSLGAAVDVGSHDLARIARATAVIVSPGVPPDAPPLAAAREARVPVASEVELGLRALAGTPYIAVTGTNGKTTTTALAGHLLRALGRRAVEAGNIGTPLSAVALATPRPEWIALELSSFQLHDLPSIDPTVGVLTNVTPDHLDRYPSAEAYYADKALLFRNAHPGSRWVINRDDPRVVAMAMTAAGAHHDFAAADPTAEMVYVPPWGDAPDPAGLVTAELRAGSIVWRGRRLIRRDELPLLGDHNVMNAMAASVAVLVADAAHQTAEARAALAEGLRTFRALAHRMEIVGEFGGVLWINDSKATNVSAARVAVEGITRPAVVLLGGRHKGEPYTALAEPLRAHATAVIAYGEAAPLIARDLSGLVPLERLGSDFGAVVARARALAAPGGAVLLAPACSSYDMFANYEERGTTFRELARADAGVAAR